MKEEKKDPPEFLYRYTWLNPEYPEKSFENIFKENKIYAPSVANLNDPFDCVPLFNLGSRSEEEHRKDIIKDFKEKNSLEDLKIFTGILDSLGSGAPQKYFLYNYYQRFVPELLKKCRVLSFSAVKNDGAMWAYYANSAYGFCIEFRTKDMKKSLLEVEYISSVFNLKIENLKKEEDWIKEVVSKKNDHWSHEEEWRCFAISSLVNSKDFFITLPSDCICSIEFGANMKDEEKEKIRGWIQSYGKDITIEQQPPYEF